MNFTEALHHLWPNGDHRIIGLRQGIVNNAAAVLSKYGITSPLTFAHIMAQISHECGAGTAVEENLFYSAQRLIAVWPKHFNASNANTYAHNPKKLASYIYSPPIHNDLGNVAGTDDGWNFRGRGATQCTGRANYTKLSAKTGLDLVGYPDLVNDPEHFLECGVAAFILCGCLPYAIANNVLMVTKRLNGGTIGFTSRKMWLARWIAAEVPFPTVA